MKIYCPRCAYEPSRRDLWRCQPGCKHVWHTFDTQGVCPRCGKMWRETKCPACKQWSPHDDWYHDEERSEERERSAAEQEMPA